MQLGNIFKEVHLSSNVMREVTAAGEPFWAQFDLLSPQQQSYLTQVRKILPLQDPIKCGLSRLLKNVMKVLSKDPRQYLGSPTLAEFEAIIPLEYLSVNAILV